MYVSFLYNKFEIIIDKYRAISLLYGIGVQYILWNINSLAPGRFDYSLKLVNVKLISTIDILSILCEIAIRWMPQHLTEH